MKRVFRIHRTSEYLPDPNKPPHKRAYWGMCNKVDIRNVDDPAKVPYFACDVGVKKWYEEGFNHKVVNGCIQREIPEEAWLIALTDKEFFRLVQDLGCNVILTAPYRSFSYDIWSIEIYDDHRE